MTVSSSKYSCYIDLDVSSMDYDSSENSFFFFGKDLIGNRYKVYIPDVTNMRVGNIFCIHTVEDK